MNAYQIHFTLGMLLLLAAPNSAFAAVCDVDSNGYIDKIDITEITLARPSRASFYPVDPRDTNGDLLITKLDERACVQKCSRPQCTIVYPQMDYDKDKINNSVDNCLTIYNPDQGDSDSDGTGDVCEIVGNITITSPNPKQIINTSTTSVVGTFSTPTGSGVMVNRRRACIYNNQFVINNIPVNRGSYVLTAQLIPSIGVGVSNHVEVYRNGDSKFSVEVNSNCAVTPFDASYRITELNAEIQRIEIDYDGDGITDASEVDLTKPIFEYKYKNPGIYKALITGIDGAGNSITESLGIVVQDGVVIDSNIQAVWQNIITGLSTKNITLALNQLTPGAQGKYTPVFNALQGKLPEIVKTFSSLQVVDINTDFAEYAINRTINGENRLFLVYFVKDYNGIWKLYSM